MTLLIKGDKEMRLRIGGKNKQEQEMLTRLAAIVESADDAIIAKSLDGTIISWNKGAESMYGYSAAEIIGKNISVLTEPGRADEVPKILERIKGGEKVEHYETVRIGKDGKRVDVSLTVSAIRDKSGIIIGASTIARDIAERKKLEEGLRAVSLYARSLIEASLDPLVTISPEGKIMDVNKATEMATGVSREKLIGTDFSDYFTEPAIAGEGYRTVFEKGFVKDYPLTIRHSLGKLTEVLYNASVYKDKTGNVLGVFAAARDITERKKAERELMKYREQLEEMVSQRTAELTRVLKEVREATNVLASAASEILTAATQVAAGSTETATSVSETTTTVEEVKQTAQVSNQKARYVSESAQKAAQVSQSGKKAVEQSISGMNSIREQMESIAESAVRLSEQGQAIGEIAAAVTDIAEQVNLLAVNAAIEAARAGEQGRGFTVVAQEVKSLAEQAKQATAQVRTILNDVQKRISAAVMVTEQGSKAAEAGVKQAAEAGEAIRLLADSITEAAQAATQVAASSQQQLVGMDQVASAMMSIKEASIQTITSTKQAETSARNLFDLSQRMKELVEQIKV